MEKSITILPLLCWLCEIKSELLKLHQRKHNSANVPLSHKPPGPWNVSSRRLFLSLWQCGTHLQGRDAWESNIQPLSKPVMLCIPGRTRRGGLFSQCIHCGSWPLRSHPHSANVNQHSRLNSLPLCLLLLPDVSFETSTWYQTITSTLAADANAKPALQQSSIVSKLADISSRLLSALIHF